MNECLLTFFLASAIVEQSHKRFVRRSFRKVDISLIALSRWFWFGFGFFSFLPSHDLSREKYHDTCVHDYERPMLV
jgi:hypothetical protein